MKKLTIVILLILSLDVNAQSNKTPSVSFRTPYFTSKEYDQQVLWRVDSLVTIPFICDHLQSVELFYSTDGNSWKSTNLIAVADSNKKEFSGKFEWKVPNVITKGLQLLLYSTNPKISSARSSVIITTDKKAVSKLPLTIGNKWFYKIFGFNANPVWRNYDEWAEIWELKDFVKNEDGLEYARMFIYSTTGSNNYKLIDSCFINQSGDQVTAFGHIQAYDLGPLLKIQKDFSKDLVLYRENRVKNGYSLMLTNATAQRVSYILADSIGFTEYNYFWNQYYGNGFHLAGCILSGKKYGEVIENYTVGIEEGMESLPSSFFLSQNYPNPFNPSTTIDYQLSTPGFVTLKVYDLLGREVSTLVDEFKNAGTYNSTFNTLHSSLTSGVYFYRLQSGSYSETKKLILMK